MGTNRLMTENPWLVIVPRLAVFKEPSLHGVIKSFLPLCTRVEVLEQNGRAAHIRSGPMEGWVEDASTNLEPERTLPPLTHRVTQECALYLNREGTHFFRLLPKGARFAAGVYCVSGERTLVMVQPLLSGQAWIDERHTKPLTA